MRIAQSRAHGGGLAAVNRALVQKSRISHENSDLDRKELFLCKCWAHNAPRDLRPRQSLHRRPKPSTCVRQLRKAGARQAFREVASGAKSDRANVHRALDHLDADGVRLTA
jgi:hypothetical protein